MNILFIIKILLIVAAIITVFVPGKLVGFPVFFLAIAMLIDVIQEKA